MFNRFGTKLFLILATLSAAIATQASTCGPPPPSGGAAPTDYRKAQPEALATVEKFHFTPDVEALRKGASSANMGRDLEFVLTYFPNHWRALNAMLRLAKRENTDRPGGANESIDCWFERAVEFQPDDGTVHLLYALWLVHTKDTKAATKELEIARDRAPPQNANYVYNLGLAYLEVGDPDRALEAAQQAYALGYPLPGLRDALKKLGKWKPTAQDAPTGSDPAMQRQGTSRLTAGSGATTPK